MKRILAMVLAMMLAMAVLSGCSDESQPEPTTGNDGQQNTQRPGGGDASGLLVGDPGEEYYMISFLSGIDYWKTCFEGFQDAAGQYGVKTIYSGDPTADVAKQVSVFEEVAAKKPKGIAITCVNADALKEPIDKAIADGIAVVTFDSDSPDSIRPSYLSTGNEEAGAQAAAYFAESMPGGANVALLYTVGAENSESRVRGFENYCATKAPQVKVAAKVNDKGDQIEATKNMAAQLQADPTINAVFCMDGVAGVAGPTAVAESGLQGIKVLSFDTDSAVLDMIKSGQIEATVAQGTYNMGYWSMRFLFDLAHSLPKKLPPSFVDTGVTIVTKANVDDYYVSGGSQAPVARPGALTGDPGEEYYMISFLSGIDYWKTCFEGFQDAANQYGVKTVYSGDPTADVAKQVSVFEEVAAKKPKGIAITCVNADALKEPIDNAIRQGIQVVTFDSDSPDSLRPSYLSTGNEEAGARAAAYFAQIMPSGANVALLYTVGAENSESRVRGFENYCATKAPQVKVAAKVNDKGDQIEATKNMAAQLQADPTINAVFCMDGV
ncbi:MAG: substrate-binding domain-containing protein, partial [Oscillospiraceae bacterium]|nr:substrate-binding domain-containing protein [Oscillospiraceae bacterium]